jgi:hypothetical protein
MTNIPSPVAEVARVELTETEHDRLGHAIATADAGEVAEILWNAGRHDVTTIDKVEDVIDDVVYLWERDGRPHGAHPSLGTCDCSECNAYDHWERLQTDS